MTEITHNIVTAAAGFMRWRLLVLPGESVRLTWRAMWVATREEEQAVSVEMQGPRKPKLYDSLPTIKLRPWPVMAAELESATPWSSKM